MRASLKLAAILLAAVVGNAAGQDSMPTVSNPPAIIKTLKPHEVVEHVLAQQHDLLLSPDQIDALTRLDKAVKGKGVVYEPTGRGKPPENRAVRITTPEQALAKAYAVLTPQQQHKSLMLFQSQQSK